MMAALDSAWEQYQAEDGTLTTFWRGAEFHAADVEDGFRAGWAAACSAVQELCPGECGCRLGTDDADRFECGCGAGCCGDVGTARADCGCGWKATGADVGQLSAEVRAHMLTHLPGTGGSR